MSSTPAIAAALKRTYSSTKLHGVTLQETAILILSFVSLCGPQVHDQGRFERFNKAAGNMEL